MAPSEPRPEVVAIGEPLVALIGQQRDVPLVEVCGYSAHVTGAELNAAVGLARLGHAVAFAGRVGSDPFGALVRRRLAIEGVDTRWLSDDPHPTGLLFRNLRSSAPAEVVYRRAGSAGAQLTGEDLAPALVALPEDGLALITGVTAAVCPQATCAAAELARTHRRRLCVDLNYRSRLWSAAEASALLRQLAVGAYLVTASLEEAQLVTGQPDARAAAQELLSSGTEIVVIRHDVTAASWFAPGHAEPFTLHGERLSATDAVGAGDAFMAGLISGLLEFGAAAPHACLQRAHHCGAAVIATVGDLEGALNRAELSVLEAGGIGNEPLR